MATITPERVDELATSMSRSEWEALYMDHAAGRSSALFPFPVDEVQAVTNRNSGEETAAGAIKVARCVTRLADQVVQVSREQKILDYGCGWGRITRLLPYDFDCRNIVGVDVDGALIAKANELVPAIEHFEIESMKPMPFDDGTFDVIFANSVFSHLSETSHLFAVDEISRCLRPGGVAVLSTLGLEHLERFFSNQPTSEWIQGVLGPEPEARERLEEERFIWGDTGRWHEYGIAVVHPDWLDLKWKQRGLSLVNTGLTEHQGSQIYNVAVRES